MTVTYILHIFYIKLLGNRPHLQQLAFYSHQLPKKIQKFFQLPQAGSCVSTPSQSQVKKFTKELNAYSRLRCAGLTLLAALIRALYIFSEISHFLERFLIEHVDTKRSLDSKLQI